jgi:hypothetical protein
MDDQNQANNQLGNQPKKDPADVSSSAPVEMEPATNRPPMGQPAAPAPTPPVEQPMQAPVEPKLDMPPQPQLLEAPKKKSAMLIVVVVVALVVALGLLGAVVYSALY